jgi:hypothetical protein
MAVQAMLQEVCNHFNNKMHRFGPDISTEFCGLHYVRRPKMREISPAINISAEAFLQKAPGAIRAQAEAIRAHKRAGERPRPSATLLDQSSLLTKDFRYKLLDQVASYVDENLFGRSEMCQQFALLIARALVFRGLPAVAVAGEAIYFRSGKRVFSWQHAWVRVGSEVIDGNVDSLYENPAVPSSVRLQPYWGEITNVPSDRKLRQALRFTVSADPDVDDVWWPELNEWLSGGGS